MSLNLSSAHDFYEQIWLPSELVLSDIERSGILLDADACEKEFARLTLELEPLEVALNDWAGRELNWRSPKQVAALLYDERGFPIPPVKGGLKAVQMTDEDDSPTGEASICHLMDHQPDQADKDALRRLLKWKKLSREAQFSRDLPKFRDSRGRIHCQLAPHTETGRLTAKNPNLQQIPSPGDPLRELLGMPDPRVRRAFVAQEGYSLVVLDYASLEWRILAHILAKRYGDTTLVDDIRDDVDPHSATAVRMGLSPGPVDVVKLRHPSARAMAKILNYSINYGKTGAGLGVQIRDDAGNPIGRDRGDELIQTFYQANPGIARFHQDITDYWLRNGYVRTLLGRYRYIERGKKRWQFNKGRRLALNTPIQGSAADIVTMAMLRCNAVRHAEQNSTSYFNAELEALGCRTVLQVHDELVFECPTENAPRAKEVLTHAMETCLEGIRDFLCPLEVDGGIGRTWAEAGGK